MSPDLDAARDFMTGHARVLDRRRFALMAGDTDDPAGALAALDAYRNADGGYGFGLEPDLRAPESQPGAALHAFEVFEEAAPAVSPRARELCDFLASVTLEDGGLPFATPLSTTVATAPWWAGADPSVSSLQTTAITAALAVRVGRHDPAVAEHPWLARASAYCAREIAALEGEPHAYVLSFALQYVDAVGDETLLERLAPFVPRDGSLRVAGGTEDERLRPLDLSPAPGLPSRALLDPAAIDADLDRLATLQQDDGGWTVDYAKISEAGALEWRGIATFNAVQTLRRNGRA
ncbi:MAG TPA: hypothetical protein VN238_08015 [Solirubrobacteraceae bacterium]|nr:hypothetical protein [Solirubrobacteraceae bacterium]